MIFINEEEKRAWSFPSDQTERSPYRNIFTIIVSRNPSANKGVIIQRLADTVRERSRSKKPTGWTEDTERGREKDRDAYTSAKEPRYDGPEVRTHCCSTDEDGCFQSYFNELAVHLLLARWHNLSSQWKAIPLAAQRMQIMRARRRKFKQLCPRLKAGLEEVEASNISKQPSGWDSGRCSRLPHGNKNSAALRAVLLWQHKDLRDNPWSWLAQWIPGPIRKPWWSFGLWIQTA